MGVIKNMASLLVKTGKVLEALPRLKFNAWTLGGRGAEIFEKSAEDLELERMNPLRGVDEWRLGQIFDDARDGIYADLAWLYNEIESVEPALVACCDMRESAASECGWLVKTPDAERTRMFDAKLAEDQRDALLAEFGALDDDFADLAAHLVSAFFRGAAHALPLWNADGSLAGFRKLDLWNFAFDRKTGIWYWNADASRDEGTFQAIPAGELVSLAVSSSRHVDHAALPIFIRAALGTKRYGVWLDRFGIPPVAVIMPPNAEKGEQGNYMDLARKFARGGNGILPNGTAVSYGTEARAVCPFPDFIRFQQEQIYMIGIGRVQSGANDAANLGGNAAGVVEAGFTRIVRRDARRIARAINDCVTRKVLARLFPGRPALAQFAWDTEPKRTSREVLEDAGFAKNAGLSIDIDQIQELTGYKLEKDSSSELGSESGKMPFFNSKTPLQFVLNANTPLQTRENGLQNAPRNPDGQGEGSDEPPSQIAKKRPSGAKDVLAAFADDMGPASEAVKKFLADPGKEAAERLIADLPGLLPEDPALAAVIADAMAEAAAGEIASVENTIDANGAEHGEPGSGHGGQFVSKGEGGGASGASPAKPTEKSYTPAAKESVEKFQKELPDDITPEEFDSILTAGFSDTDGAGNPVKYGTLLRDHINDGGRNEQDRDARKKRLGVVVKMVRGAEPVATTRSGGNERVYAGVIDGKAYVAVADEHNEIGAVEMVSYRRDGKHDAKK